MVKIHFLGTCSGTEPMIGMHHCSLIIDVNGAIYWFDAGESAAYTAYTAGIDIMKTHALFISHPHFDHIGGLPHLLWCYSKLVWRYKTGLVCDNSLDIYFPEQRIFDAAKVLATSVSPSLRFTLNEHLISDGVLREDKNIKVTAMHNRHLKEDGSCGFHSYSFLIQAEGKNIVFSGDLASVSELDGIIPEKCDVLITETGHHSVKDVCEYAISHKVGQLCFNHHGREILNDHTRAEKTVADYASESGIPMMLCHDGLILNL